MEFHLSFAVPPFQRKISYSDKIMLAGSCFTENIGAIMEKHCFDVFQNSHGILYNPISLAKSLTDVISNRIYNENDLFNFNTLWASWQHHGRFSNPDKEKCLEGINNSISAANSYLKSAGWLMVTFGSAYAYELLSGNKIVANCHKYPNREFRKVLLDKEKIVAEWKKLIQTIKKINPGINIIFTVSPVRYIRDGVVENNLSKAVLLQTVHELCAIDNVSYFPAYELVIDDLRDYRFYKEDMVHPNELAVNYVWEKFSSVAFSDETIKVFWELMPLVLSMQHRPLHGNSETDKERRMVLAEKIELLLNKYPFLPAESLRKLLH